MCQCTTGNIINAKLCDRPDIFFCDISGTLFLCPSSNRTDCLRHLFRCHIIKHNDVCTSFHSFFYHIKIFCFHLNLTDKRSIGFCRKNCLFYTVRRLMEEEPRYRAVLKKQVKAADGTIDISWINEDLITFVKDRLGHDQRYAIDPTKITNALGWYPETKFEVGIVKTIEWYLNNQPWVEEVTSGDYQKYYEQMYGGRG